VSSETRVIRSLKARKLDTWDSKVVKVQAIHADFHIDYLGMNMDVYEFIAKQATTIIHCAWPVNFLVPFGSFDQAIHGVENLLRLANSERRKRFVFCSSTASVIQTNGTIREELSNNPEDANPLGYSRSKWVAENIVKQMGGDVIRLGQLSGDTQAGIWNSDEGWPLILKTVGIIGSLPVLNERIEWLPVDIAARAIVNIAMSPQGIHGSGVWHVLNKCPVMWSDVLDAMEMYCGKFNRLEPKEWLRQLEEEEKKGAAIKLLSFWKDAVSFLGLP
jgi:thioester reductase-like protein